MMIKRTQIDKKVKQYISSKYPEINVEHILYCFERPFITPNLKLIDPNDWLRIYFLYEIKTLVIPYTFPRDLSEGRAHEYSLFPLSSIDDVSFNYSKVKYRKVALLDLFIGYKLDVIPLDVNLIIGEQYYKSYRETTNYMKYTTGTLPILIDIEKVYNNLSYFEQWLEDEKLRLLELIAKIEKAIGLHNDELENANDIDDCNQVRFIEVTGKEVQRLLTNAYNMRLDIRYVPGKYYSTNKFSIFEENATLVIIGPDNPEDIKDVEKFSVEDVVLLHYIDNRLHDIIKVLNNKDKNILRR